MTFNYYRLFRSSRLRDELERLNIEFTPLEKIFLIYHSNLRMDIKEEVLSDIMNEDGYLVITSENASGCEGVWGMRLDDILKTYLKDRHQLLDRLMKDEPRVYYTADIEYSYKNFDDKEYATVKLPGYYATYNECKNALNKYFETMPEISNTCQGFTIEKRFFNPSDSIYDDAVIFATFNAGWTISSIEEIGTGLSSCPDPDVEFMKQLDFDFLTPYKTTFRSERDYI